MWTINIFVVFLFTQILLSAGISIASTRTEIEKAPENPTGARGLFQDFYMKQMEGNTISTMSSQLSSSEENFGEKFTNLVAQTAVAMADAGQETVQQIIGSMGDELGEALKF